MRGWTALGEKSLGKYHLLHLRERIMQSGRTGEVVPFVVVSLSDWVNVVAVTPDNELVLVEQPRVGIDDVTIEIPGGTIDDGEQPELAARRELLEETGYAAEEMVYLGKAAVNPALQDNWCHFYLARDAVKRCEPSPDPAEDINVRLVDMLKVLDMIEAGEIVHSLGMLGILKAERVLGLTKRLRSQ